MIVKNDLIMSSVFFTWNPCVRELSMIDFKYSYFSPLLLSWKLSQAFVDAYLIYLGIVFDPSARQNLKELEKTVRLKYRLCLMKDSDMRILLTCFLTPSLYMQILQSSLALNEIYQNFSNLFSILE